MAANDTKLSERIDAALVEHAKTQYALGVPTDSTKRIAVIEGVLVDHEQLLNDALKANYYARAEIARLRAVIDALNNENSRFWCALRRAEDRGELDTEARDMMRPIAAAKREAEKAALEGGDGK